MTMPPSSINYMLLRSRKQQQASPSSTQASHSQPFQLQGSTKKKRTRMKKWAKKCGRAMRNPETICSTAVSFHNIFEKRFCSCGLTREVSSWSVEVQWANQRLKGKSLISVILRVAWSAAIYVLIREDRSSSFRKRIIEYQMDEIRDTAKAYYRNSPKLQSDARACFKSWDKNGDEKIDLQEFYDKLNQQGIKGLANQSFFKELDKNGNGTLDFDEFLTLYYIIESGRFEFCEGCEVFLKGVYFTCVQCYNDSTTDTFDLCRSCYENEKFQHHANATFVDNYMLLRSKKSQQHVSKRTKMKKWAKRCAKVMISLLPSGVTFFHLAVN
ncbi:hypothetical protein CRYUN_Cryun10bG0030900 [Craigia yunnanensis]